MSDPDEQTNVVDLHPEVALRLRDQLEEIRDSMVPRAVDSVALDPEAQRRLESLGYVGASMTGGEDDVERRDPKEMLPVFREYHRATSLTHQQKLEEALSILEPLARQSPESDAIHGSLGRLYIALDRLEEAEKSFKTGLRSEPDNPLRRYGLAEALRRQGKTAEAIACFERIVAIMPDFGQAHRGLCSIYAKSGRFDKAYQHCRRDAELNPATAEVQLNLGKVLFELGRHDDSVVALRNALQHDPGNKPGHLLLFRALAAAGRRAELIPALRAAYAASPDDPEIPCTLGWLLAVAREQTPAGLGEARQMADKCLGAMPDNPVSHDLMGVALARAGEFGRAIAEAELALALAEARGDRALSQRIAARLRLYRANRPYTE
jgi:tetratricopeptide (TPR) repeat protein